MKKNIIKEHFIFIKKNISILLSINQFNIELKKEIENTKYNAIKGYLINKNLLLKYKNIFLYDKIIKNFNNNKEEEIEKYINSFIIKNKEYYFRKKKNEIF